MPQINLLAWREQAKHVKKIRFIVIAISCVILAIISVVLLHVYYRGILSNQLERNSYIRSQLENEQQKLTALLAKKKQLAATNTALHFIIGLREESYRAVEFLDALTKSVPDSITVSKITREGNNITIESKSKSNETISLFIDNLVKTKIFNQPNLTLITTKENAAESDILFEVKVELKD